MENHIIPHRSDSNKPNWVTRDGRKIPVDLLADEHLKNIIAFLQRKMSKCRTPNGFQEKGWKVLFNLIRRDKMQQYFYWLLLMISEKRRRMEL